ncbi:MAG: lysozyme inhibitor LprI family protein, partial [Halieaceae bacterium]
MKRSIKQWVQLCRLIPILMLGLSVFSAPAFAVAPAFDCDKAEGEVELLICSDDDLAVLDQRLSRTYSQASANIPAEERANFRAQQRGWIKGRNDCWKAEDVRSCVEFSYRS